MDAMTSLGASRLERVASWRIRRLVQARSDPLRSGRAIVMPRKRRASGAGTVSQIAAGAAPQLVVTAVLPSVWFIVGRHVWGLAGAVTLTLAWNVSCQLVRRLRGQALSVILALGLLELVARTVVALSLNSTQLYFTIPALLTALTGVFCLVSAFSPRPAVARVLEELVPRSILDVDDPQMSRLLARASLLYGAEQIAVAIVTLTMVFSLSTTAYVAIHPAISWAALGLFAAAAAPTFRRSLAAATHRQDAISDQPLVLSPGESGAYGPAIHLIPAV